MLNEKSPIQALLSLLQEVYYLGSDERVRLVDACLLHAEGIVTCTNHRDRSIHTISLALITLAEKIKIY